MHNREEELDHHHQTSFEKQTCEGSKRVSDLLVTRMPKFVLNPI